MIKNIIKYLSAVIFSICTIFLYSCLTVPATNANTNNRIRWEVIDRISLEYDMDLLEENFILFTTVEDRVRIFNKFIEYWNNAMLVKITSEINLNNNSEHELIISRRWVEREFVSFFIYKFQVNHINYSLIYEFILDNRRGAANFGSDNRFFNLFNQDKEVFHINIRSEKRIIANRLRESENPLALIQALSILTSLELESNAYLYF